MLLLLAALTTSVAQAGDGAHVALAAGPVFTPEDAQMAVAARVVGRKDAYLGVDARYGVTGAWTGRVGLGFDLLGGSKLDLQLGLFMGGLGAGPYAEPETVFGTAVGLGFGFDHLYGHYRLHAGKGGSGLAGLHTENELLVGYRLAGDLRVFGRVLTLDPGVEVPHKAVGLGVEVRL